MKIPFWAQESSLKTWLSSLVGIISSVMLFLWTALLGVFLFISIALRFLSPRAMGRRWANPMIIQVALAWVGGILNWILYVQRIQIDIDHEIEFNHQQWNLIVANHQSWFDIFALLHLTHRKLPILKFFIKKQLFWVPIAGAAWWALDYPFMERYSKSYLEKHPEKAGQDLETTKRSCEKFSEQPTTIVNFLEGTRFTKTKHQMQNSPFKHLLKPKAGGIAFAIQALGEKFDTILDATIHYQGQAPSYWNMACGRIDRVTLQVKKRDIPKQFLNMDYTKNLDDKKAFQEWVTGLWEIKDETLSTINGKMIG